MKNAQTNGAKFYFLFLFLIFYRRKKQNSCKNNVKLNLKMALRFTFFDSSGFSEMNNFSQINLHQIFLFGKPKYVVYILLNLYHPTVQEK